MRKGENHLFFLNANKAVYWIIKELLAHFPQPNWYFASPAHEINHVRENINNIAEAIDYSLKQVTFIPYETEKLETGVRKVLQKKKVKRIFWFIDDDRFSAGRLPTLEKNVAPLEQFLILTQKLNPIPAVHFLSSALINGNSVIDFGESNFNEGQGYRNYYEESRYIAEHKIRKSDLFKNTFIYRKGFWVGSKKNSACEFSLNQLVPISRLESWPGIFPVPVIAPGHYYFPLTPIEYFSNAMIAVLENENDMDPQTFHLTDPNPYAFQAILKMVCQLLERSSLQFKIGAYAIPLLEKLNFIEPDSNLVAYYQSVGKVVSDKSARLFKKYKTSCPELSDYVTLYLKN